MTNRHGAGTNRAAIPAAGPGRAADPLAPMQVTFNELRVSVEEAGRYDLVLLAGDDEIATQPLLIGPAEVFRGDGA